MNKILTIDEAIKKSEELQREGKKVVLVGGCFDILHIGHITFLEKAKKEGDVLFILLEDDVKIKELKGQNRPINTQEDRAKILASLTTVDFVVMLTPMQNDILYDELIIHIKPAIIATTTGDPGRSHKERQARLINAKVVDVTQMISNKSTTKLVEILNEL